MLQKEIVEAYGGEENISRNLDYFSSEIKRLGNLSLDAYLRSTSSLLVIGIGRGLMLFDILTNYPSIQNIKAFSRENLLVDNPQALRHAVYTHTPIEQWPRLQSIDY